MDSITNPNPNILFVHSISIYKNNSTYYTNGSYSMDVWNRYLIHSKKFSVLANIVYKNKNNVYSNIFDHKKIKIFDMKLERKSRIKKFFSIKNRLSIRKKIKAAVKQCDVLILRMPSQLSYIAFDYGKKYNKKIIIEVAGSIFHALWYYNFLGKIYAIPTYLKMRRRIKKANNVIYVTSQYLQKLYPTSGKSISCSNVNIQKKDILNRKETFRELLNKEIQIGIIGKVDVKYKGHKTVLRALTNLSKKYDINFKLQLVGSGDRNKLIKFSKKLGIFDKVEYLGSMRHDEVLKWLSKIDIYIQPSLTEGLPRAVLEAMACGCIVIGSNAGGIPELLNEKFIFKKGRHNDLVKVLINLFENLDLISKNIERNKNELSQYLKENLENKRYSFIHKVIYDK